MSSYDVCAPELFFVAAVLQAVATRTCARLIVCDQLRRCFLAVYIEVPKVHNTQGHMLCVRVVCVLVWSDLCLLCVVLVDVVCCDA